MSQVRGFLLVRKPQTHHSADGATDSVGLELTVEATSHLVNLQSAESIQSGQNSTTEKHCFWHNLPPSVQSTPQV